MPRTPKNPQREDESAYYGDDDPNDGYGAPRDEPANDKTAVKLYDDDNTIDLDEDDIALEIDIDDLIAVEGEGPDA